MNKEKFTLQEEINRMKKLATYDKSKTLNEQDHGYNSLNEINDNAGNMRNEQSVIGAPNYGMIDTGPAPAPAPAPAPQNDLYTKKFSCIPYEPKDGDTVGHYNPANMDFLRLFFKDNIYVYWENKTIKKYVRNGNAAGAEVKKGTWKCKSDNSNVDVVWANNTPAQTTPKTPSITDKNVLNTLKFDFQYPGDKGYSYAFVPGTVAEATSTQTGTWYAKNNKTGKVFDVSKNYPQTAQKLSTQFPNGAKAGTQTPETPTAAAAAPTATQPVAQPAAGAAELPKSENKANWDNVVKYYEGNKDPNWKFYNKGEIKSLSKIYDFVSVKSTDANKTNPFQYFYDDGAVNTDDNLGGTWEWDGTKPVITPSGTAAAAVKPVITPETPTAAAAVKPVITTESCRTAIEGLYNHKLSPRTYPLSPELITQYNDTVLTCAEPANKSKFLLRFGLEKKLQEVLPK